MIQRLMTMLTLLVMTTLPISAQKDIKIETLFGKDYIERHKATEVMVQGKELKSYDLTLFRSVTFKKGDALSEKVEQWIEADTRNAYDKEVGRLDGRLYYGFFCLPPHKGKNRYLFYRTARTKA